MVSAVWAMLATNTRDRQIITPSESGDPAIVCVCVCVCMQTHPQLICSLFSTDTVCLCFILSGTTLFTLEISPSRQQLPTLVSRSRLVSFVELQRRRSLWPSPKSLDFPGREPRTTRFQKRKNMTKLGDVP